MEEIYLENIIKAAVPIIYGGVFSVGIAYTLQVIGQKHSRASHAAIIMSSESVFALIGGMLFLNETINLREIVGCTLMISGVILSQLQGKISRPPTPRILQILIMEDYTLRNRTHLKEKEAKQLASFSLLPLIFQVLWAVRRIPFPDLHR